MKKILVFIPFVANQIEVYNERTNRRQNSRFMAPNRSITPQLLKVGKQYQEVGYSEKIRGYVTFEYLTCPISQKIDFKIWRF